ncbi:hypothetical protein [Micromonospora sp. URMC 103]|uniref:hypothetical protein n=1 Tax=Micromonospora sp. URMC 103 TaxID=3423406 RepID=UPI003F1DCE5A
MKTTTWADVTAATQAAITGGKPCAAGCRWPVHPAATVGNDGTPDAFDVHPGCQPGGQQLRVIEGGKA